MRAKQENRERSGWGNPGSDGDTLEILLAEDNPGDVRLVQEALRESHIKNQLHVVADGDQALSFLRRQGQYTQAVRPNLILLDLNLPKKDGGEVLIEIKADANLSYIPVVVLTTSNAEEDVRRTYGLHANCYITKPLDFEQFLRMMRSIEDFWFNVVRLPSRN